MKILNKVLGHLSYEQDEKKNTVVLISTIFYGTISEIQNEKNDINSQEKIGQNRLWPVISLFSENAPTMNS